VKAAQCFRVGSAIALFTTSLPSCQRRAELREQQTSIFKPPPMVTANVRELDSGLGTAMFPACATRQLGPCQGPADLPCNFSRWANATAEICFEKTGCRTDGTIEIKMSAEGCVVGVSMDKPNDEFVQCIVQEVGYVRCPCGVESTASRFLGLGNDGCRVCSAEFACPGGLVCANGQCVDERADAGDGGI
jgi:hypothetical protein